VIRGKPAPSLLLRAEVHALQNPAPRNFSRPGIVIRPGTRKTRMEDVMKLRIHNLVQGACAAALLSLNACAAGMAGGSVDAFNDPNVAASASSSNMDEIQTSQLAVQRAQNPQVREFAQMMVSQHGTFEQEMQAMLSSKGMAPMDNAFSGTLKRHLPPTLQMLQSMSGAQFDMAYMLHQVGAHELTLHALDTTLIPSTTDPDMRAMLQDRVRPAVAEHLQRAMQIVAMMRAQ
jgi:putative membrane protein